MLEVDLIWFMAWNVDEFLYNFMYRMSWILQSIFLYLGGRLGVGELNTDVLLWCQTYWSFQTIYWFISLFLHLVTLIYLLLCTYFCCTLVHRSYTTGHAARSTSLLKYKQRVTTKVPIEGFTGWTVANYHIHVGFWFCDSTVRIKVKDHHYLI